jgi:pimeloyl-ACP methyl ester carboxylesterase
MLRPPEMALIIVVGVLVLGSWSLTVPAAHAGAVRGLDGIEAPLPYEEEFIPVEENVKLQVLDWGGTGRPVILLAGLGYDAHEWDSFAPKLVLQYHVYAVSHCAPG